MKRFPTRPEGSTDRVKKKRLVYCRRLNQACVFSMGTLSKSRLALQDYGRKLGKGFPPISPRSKVCTPLLRATFDVLHSTVFGAFVVVALINSANAAESLGVIGGEQSHQVLLSRLPLGQVASSNAGETDRKTLLAIYKQAIADDAAGRHEQARKLFDVLPGSELESLAAVPSAVNLVALERYAEAKAAFASLANSANERDASYAQLWLLWLSARTQAGKPADIQKHLAAQAVGFAPRGSAQQALIALYRGKGSVEAVFDAVNSMAFSDELQRRDARTEAAFFAGGYLQYARQDKPAALRLYQRELPNASASIERPLLTQAIATLATSSY